MNDLNNNTYPKRPFSSLLYRLVALLIKIYQKKKEHTSILIK